MSLLDEAKRLAMQSPFRNECVAGHTSKAPVTCLFCATPSFSHAPDCPWLAMPRIVAALEAAERVISTYDHPDNCDGTVPINGPEYRALVAAMQGERVTA